MRQNQYKRQLERYELSIREMSKELLDVFDALISPKPAICDSCKVEIDELIEYNKEWVCPLCYNVAVIS